MEDYVQPQRNTLPLPSGISRRDWFAANAPADIPKWFEWEPERKRPAIPSKYELESEEMRNQLEGLGDYLDEKNVHPDVVELAGRMAAARSDLEAWQREATHGRYIAWRWAYADMMIEQEPK